MGRYILHKIVFHNESRALIIIILLFLHHITIVLGYVWYESSVFRFIAGRVIQADVQ